MPPISDCAHGAKNVPLCLAFMRLPLSVVVPSGSVITVAGMFHMAQWLPKLSMPALISVVSKKVMAKDMVPAGAFIHSRSGLMPFPRPPTDFPDRGGLSWQVYLLANFAPSA